MMTDSFRKVVAAWLAATVVACGGGSGSGGSAAGGPSTGGGSGTNPDPGAEISGINGGGRWVAQGAVSRLGSIYVNGVRYDTSGATINVNGTPAGEAELKPGQVLRVLGDVATGGLSGRAERVDYEDSLRGRITRVTYSSGTFTVLGQEVRIGLETVFGPGISPRDIESLATGDGVIVSAFADANGRLRASRIDRDPSPGSAEVVGRVSTLDSAARRFNINGLVVDYGGANLDGFPGGGPANGEVVRVRGPHPVGSGALVATAVSWRAAGVVADTNDNVQLEGLVTRFAAAGDFDLARQRIVTDGSTVYVATTAASLKANDLLVVQGVRNGSGQLVADRIEAFPTADIEIEARIDAVDTTAGTLNLLGIDVFTNARTRFVGDDDEVFSLADLRAGDVVEIAGYVAAGRFMAVRIEREEDDDDGDGGEVEIEGPVTDLAQPEFRIGGIRIVTDSETEFDDTTAAAFFAGAAGRRVEVEGAWTGTYVRATEVDLDD